LGLNSILQRHNHLRSFLRHLYGSARLGMYLPEKSVISVSTESKQREVGYLGKQVFELSNHLGNIIATITDKKLQVSLNTTSTAYFEADVQTVQDYYAGGMIMQGRIYESGSDSYRYGFGGKEKDNENSGDGNKYDFGARIYDSRLSRWLSVDPLQSKYAGLTPYNYVANSPISAIDPDGRLIIFINGLRLHVGAADQGRSESTVLGWFQGKSGIYGRTAGKNGTLERYWQEEKNTFGRKVDIAQLFIDRVGDDNAYFTSGSAEWGSQANANWFERNILGDQSRYQDGIKKAKEFHKMVQDGKIKLADDETIKIVTHSQGGAHGEGFAKQLMSYKNIDGSSVYNIEVIYNITPHQSPDMSSPLGIRGVQYSHPNDAVSSSGIIVDQLNGGSSFGRIKGISEFDERQIMGGPVQPKATGFSGNRNGHNAPDNDFIFSIPEGQKGYVAPRKDKKRG